MGDESITGEDLQVLSGKAHTYESLGRSLVAAVMASVADQVEGSIEIGRTIQVEAPTLTLKQLKKGMVWVCVGVPGFGTFCKLERPEAL